MTRWRSHLPHPYSTIETHSNSETASSLIKSSAVENVIFDFITDLRNGEKNCFYVKRNDILWLKEDYFPVESFRISRLKNLKSYILCGGIFRIYNSDVCNLKQKF